MMQIPDFWYEDEDFLFLLYHLSERCDTLQDSKLVNTVLKKVAHLRLSPPLCPELKRIRQRVENPRVPLTCCVSSQAFWWMTLIFLSTSDYFYVYLDIFLMGFHLSSTDWKGQEGKGGESEKESQSKREKEWGNIASRDKQRQVDRKREERET